MTTLPIAVLSCLALAAEAAPTPSAEPGAARQVVLAAVLPAAAPAPRAAAPAASEAADAPDEQEIEAEVQAQSQELEELRAAEEQTRPLDAAAPDERAARAAAALGLESPLRQRLEEALARDVGTAAAAAGRIPGLPEIDHDLRRLQAEYDIPIEVNDAVVAYVRFFQHPKVRKHFAKWLSRAPRYLPVFREILRAEGLPEDTVFLAMIESGFANLAQSRARAVGPWQFIAGTGKRMGLQVDFWVDERRDPEKSARAATRYLKELHDQFGDWRLAWAGYNAGAGKIARAQRRGQSDFWTMTRGRVLRRETKGYVPKLMAAAIVTKHREAFGFARDEVEDEAWTSYEVVTIPRATLLSHVAEAAEVPEKALLELNPELRRTCTPPRPYELKVPRGQVEAFARNWPQVSEGAGKLAFAHHRVERGEALAAVAKSYGVPLETVRRMNGLVAGRRIRAGTELVIPLSPLARRQATVAIAEPARSPRTARQAGPRAAAATPASGPDAARGTVKVASGDTLWAIAQRFGVALEELCRWNGIENPRRHRIFPGDELVVYSRPARDPARPPG
jgi:membrane-bound lytic murein transglycosylase D